MTKTLRYLPASVSLGALLVRDRAGPPISAAETAALPLPIQQLRDAALNPLVGHRAEFFANLTRQRALPFTESRLLLTQTFLAPREFALAARGSVSLLCAELRLFRAEVRLLPGELALRSEQLIELRKSFFVEDQIRAFVVAKPEDMRTVRFANDLNVIRVE